MTVYKTLRALFCAIEWHKKVPIKGLEKGDWVWGRGKEPFLKRFFPLPQRFNINLYRGQPTTWVRITYLLAGSLRAFAHSAGLKLPQTTVLRL